MTELYPHKRLAFLQPAGLHAGQPLPIKPPQAAPWRRRPALGALFS